MDSTIDFERVPPDVRETSLVDIAALYAGDLGITVENRLHGEHKLGKYAVHAGETVFSAIERAARREGVLLTTNGLGDLVLERPGSRTADVDLVEGENVTEFGFSIDHTQRFHTYRALGQTDPTPELAGLLAFNPKGQAVDELVRRSRVLVVQAEGNSNEALCQIRAEWECIVRGARSSVATAVVPGWLQHEGGAPWEPGLLVPVDFPSASYSGELLIAGVRYTAGRGGTLSHLTLTRPDAYVPRPAPPPARDLAAAIVQSALGETP